MSYCACATPSQTNEKYITIRQGDDSDFMGRKITVTVNTLADWTGFSAKFKICQISKVYPDVSSKTFEIVLTKEDTIKLPVGLQEGWIKFYDASGNSDTITISIKFNVLPIRIKN